MTVQPRNPIVKDSVVLIAGGTGSVGSALAQEFLRMGVRELRILARDETRHQQLVDNLDNPNNLVSVIGDVRDKSSLEEALNGVDIVINAAAMKHVKYCEAYPSEAIKTNVKGTENLLALCLQKNIRQFVLISSDKAANPSTTYGASKFLAEQLVVASARRNPGYKFTTVRLGNVLGSRNSVLSRIGYLLGAGKQVTINRAGVTRYVMTIRQATDLVIDALRLGKGGEVFIKDMPVVAVQDLIEVFIDRYAKRHALDRRAIAVADHPMGQGEKIHESLVSTHEIPRARAKNGLIIVAAPGTAKSTSRAAKFIYSSEHKSKLTTQEIAALLESCSF